jgi:hypothetical protein
MQPIDSIRLYPDDFTDTERYHALRSSDIRRKDSSEVCRSESRNLSYAISSLLTQTGNSNPALQGVVGHLLGGSEGTGFIAYSWSDDDFLILPIIENSLLVSRGDLYWLGHYPFIRGFNINERSIELDYQRLDVLHEQLQKQSLFLTNRKHFGHLVRDTIASELTIFNALVVRDESNVDRSFQFFRPISGTVDGFLENQLTFSMHNDFPHFADKTVYNYSLGLSPGRGRIFMSSNLLFSRWVSASSLAYSFHQSRHFSNSTSHSLPLVRHIGLQGVPHRRISNPKELRSYLHSNSIDSIPTCLTPRERAEFLNEADIVISEPSSSIYNYIAYCKPTTTCILMLPSGFRDGKLTLRDALDWSGFIHHMFSGRIIPFYGDCIESISAAGLDRLIDLPCSYNPELLDSLLASMG